MKKTFVTLASVVALVAATAPVFALDNGTTVNPEDHVALGGVTAPEKPELNIDQFLKDGTVEITQKGESVTAPSQTSDLTYDVLLDENGEPTIIAKPATAPTAQGTNLKGGIDENGKGYVYGNSVTDKEVKPAAKPVAAAKTATGTKTLPKTSAAK
ncbi:TPA: hypothetical protein ACGO2H_001209 [Streptococcus suis]